MLSIWTFLTLGLVYLHVLIHFVTCVCEIKQIYKKVPKYYCDSIEDLEEFGNSDMLNVYVYHDAEIPDLNYNMFRNVPNIEYLLIRNSTSKIHKDAFKVLQQLKILLIDHNDLKELTKDTFRDLPVDRLDLTHNNIFNIDPGTFINLSKLKNLYIGSNKLRKIPRGVFANLPMETLSLSKNRIYLIEENAFEHLENLKRLHLDGNLLTEFHPEHILNFRNKLEILWLHNNSFEKITRDTLKGLDNIKLLNLQDNKIVSILPYTFENVLNLESLVLSNNSLEVIDANIFPERGVMKLKHLYIDHNRLSFLTTKLLGRLSSLKAIQLAGNPWECSCFDLILLWLNDYDVKVKCDNEYFSGQRPICVASDSRFCTYNIDYRLINLYLNHNKNKKRELCIL